jgi:hypothetical protein
VDVVHGKKLPGMAEDLIDFGAFHGDLPESTENPLTPTLSLKGEGEPYQTVKKESGTHSLSQWERVRVRASGGTNLI